jgi:large subunit ribosomal protein L3
MEALIGRKLGMTQVFDEDGVQVPVTVIQAGPCVVVQRKTRQRDGYEAVQLGFVEQKEQRLTRSVAGHFKKAGASPRRILRELTVDAEEPLKEGETVDATIFKDTAFVDIAGVTKGKGFQGVVRRHGMGGGRATHGSSTHRQAGSIGQCVSPARILRGKKMPGQMGAVRRTAQNLRLVRVREEDSVLLVRGAVPGPSGSIVVVRKSNKKKAAAS